jgi:CRISPR-associated protein (TIGR02584 family)
MKKNILLCVAGGTPQIITETLYDLTIQKGERIDEIRVITTLEGRDKIMTGVIKGRGSSEESLLHPEKGKFFAFLKDYPQVGEIEFNEKKIALLRTRDGQTLEDIRTQEENELAGDQICEIVREICKDENARIFASAAGGRKTMSIYLTLAMSLFGRAEDSLSHVLVSPDFEMNPQFFYPTPQPSILKLRDGREVSTAEAEIYLAPIPFIRLQGTPNSLKLPEGKKYVELVKEAQSFLDKDERKLPLKINLITKEISVDNTVIKVSDYELLLYVLFAEKKSQNLGDDGFVQLNSLCWADFEGAFNRIMKARDEDESLCSNLVGTDWEFLWILVQQLEAANSEKNVEWRKKEWINFRDSLMRAFRRSDVKLRRIPPKYKISSIGNKRPKKYGISISTELINIIESTTDFQ